MSTAAREVQIAEHGHGCDQVTPEIMRGLQRELPLNDFGLPTGIYRADLLPLHLYRKPDAALGQLGEESSELFVPADSSPSRAVDGVPQESVLSLPEDYPPVVSEDAFPLDPLDDWDELDGEDTQADPFSILDGTGDGFELPSFVPSRATLHEQHSAAKPPKISEYLIAGFPAKSLHGAFVPLQYDEGFPAFDNGCAFWQQLPYEPMDAYQVFERYLLLPQGSRGDADDEDPGQPAGGARTINTLVDTILSGRGATDIQVLALLDKFKWYYHIYYWGLRTRAYDLFRVAQYRQQQELRAIETQDDHYIQARKLRHRLAQYMESEEDFWDLMTPKVAIDMFKQVTTLERISAGIPGGGPQSEKDGQNGGQSFEVMFRTIAQTQGNKGESSGNLINEDGDLLDKALEDTNATQILQQLIIRTGGGGGQLND